MGKILRTVSPPQLFGEFSKPCLAMVEDSCAVVWHPASPPGGAHQTATQWPLQDGITLATLGSQFTLQYSPSTVKEF